MRIDLRIPIIISAFYAPGLLFLIGAWVLGYSTEEAREAVAFLGVSVGLLMALTVAGALYTERSPVWWTIPGAKGDSQ